MIYRYKFREGDILYSKMGVAVLTRQTRSYWYYHLNGHMLRINKISLWRLVDRRKLTVGYGSNMKYRRKRTKDRILDLHGVKHEAAADHIREFLNFVELPCKIITGKSEKMSAIVRNIVKEYDWICYNELSNEGAYIVDGDD